jgi:hypothetical protein
MGSSSCNALVGLVVYRLTFNSDFPPFPEPMTQLGTGATLWGPFRGQRAPNTASVAPIYCATTSIWFQRRPGVVPSAQGTNKQVWAHDTDKRSEWKCTGRPLDVILHVRAPRQRAEGLEASEFVTLRCPRGQIPGPRAMHRRTYAPYHRILYLLGVMGVGRFTLSGKRGGLSEAPGNLA